MPANVCVCLGPRRLLFMYMNMYGCVTVPGAPLPPAPPELSETILAPPAAAVAQLDKVAGGNWCLGLWVRNWGGGLCLQCEVLGLGLVLCVGF